MTTAVHVEDLLRELANSAVAVAMVHGPRAGLDVLDGLPGLAGHHRLAAVRAHLLERCGALAEARQAYREAVRRTRRCPSAATWSPATRLS